MDLIFALQRRPMNDRQQVALHRDGNIDTSLPQTNRFKKQIIIVKM